MNKYVCELEVSQEPVREKPLFRLFASSPLRPGSTDSVVEPPTTSRRWFWASLQIIFGISALVFVLWKADLPEVWAQIMRAQWTYVAGAIVLNVMMVALMTWRLDVLAGVHTHSVSYLELFRAQFKAALVNGFVPGSLGGDAVRFYVLEKSIGNKPLVLATLGVERLVGLWGVLITTGIALLWNHHYLDGWHWSWGVVGILASSLMLTLILLSQRLEDALLATLAPLGKKVSLWQGARRIAGIFERLLEAIRSFRLAQHRLWMALGISLAVRVVWVCGAYLLALGMGLNLSLPLLFGVISLVDVARMLPISPPNGLGVREAMLVYLLAQVGVVREAALGFSLLIYGVMTVNALLGGALAIVQGVSKLRR